MSCPTIDLSIYISIYTYILGREKKDGILTTAFPNISILVRILFTIPVTNCEGERSSLSRVKNHLMSTMGQTRLSSLSSLCIESGLLQYFDTNSIIDKFSMKKPRKKLF